MKSVVTGFILALLVAWMVIFIVKQTHSGAEMPSKTPENASKLTVLCPPAPLSGGINYGFRA